MNKTEYIRSWKRDRRTKGLCVDCGINSEKRARCLECRKANTQSQIAYTKKRKKDRLNRGICYQCNLNPIEPNKKLCTVCSEKATFWTNKNKWKIIYEVFFHYCHGDIKCECCGERNILFLSIDHINGGGRQDFLKHGSSQNLYRHLIRSGYPSGYQIYCMNCNFGKLKNRGVCPHKNINKTLEPIIKSLPHNERYTLIEHRWD